MQETTPAVDRRHRAVQVWLLAIAAMIFVMVLVGGATRLTQSGLSIVEWQPISGVLPPLSEADWRTAFQKYQAIPQYQRVNRGMTLTEFKGIFWWEWAHRLLGRVIGVAFLLPFAWFLWRGWIDRSLRVRLWAIFGLGALQGAIGWWMVASGLAERVEVSQYRLATHLLLACLIFVATLWTARAMTTRAVAAIPQRVRIGSAVLLVMVLIQLYLGALVAGLRAGLIYNTWPLIDGTLVPDSAQLFFDVPWWRNFFENTLLVQFDHRLLAYVLWIAALLHVTDVARTTGGATLANALLLFAALTLQAMLGILTLLHQAPPALALLHQATAMVVLTVAVVHAAAMAGARGVGILQTAAAA